MRSAIADAGLEAEDIDLVVADGAGVAELDTLEVTALRLFFGDRIDAVPVTAPPGLRRRAERRGVGAQRGHGAPGHPRGSGARRRQPDRPDPAYWTRLRAGTTRARSRANVPVNARGFGGFNSSMVLRRDPASDFSTTAPRSPAHEQSRDPERVLRMRAREGGDGVPGGLAARRGRHQPRAGQRESGAHA
ncbi:hypothetical protein [Rathayibacter oskolensis]|uniref:hypothetical protein n=1 Tax=Rathayibacter oskolensis TaxID=1891671 RepID=UPI0034666FA5